MGGGNVGKISDFDAPACLHAVRCSLTLTETGLLRYTGSVKREAVACCRGHIDMGRDR